MTTGTRHLCVGARQREVSFLPMVELPDTPAIRRVASRAFHAEASLVDVFGAVAVDAGTGRAFVCTSDVTLLARHRYMQAHQREVREIVVKVSVAAPARRRVALSAVHAELPGVHVAGTMAGDAARLEVLACHDAGMAGVAVDLFVPSFERPLGVARVIEGGRKPLLVAMARAALFAESPCVRIHALVATITGARQRIVQSSATMAVGAIEMRMCAFKRISSLFRVIEFRSLPAGRGMAVCTFRSALATMNVVRRVTGNALLWRVLVAIAEMTGETRYVFVLVPQREGRLVVIEDYLAPRSAVVAARAVTAETSLVRILLAMAGVAAGGCFTEFFALHVATVASDCGMCVAQGEIRTVVIELIAAELHDVGVATEMVRVAGPTLHGRRGSSELAVEAALGADICRDAFVARETKLRLACAIALVVAVRAILLELGMQGSQLARHEKRLGIHGVSTLTREQAKKYGDYP